MGIANIVYDERPIVLDPKVPPKAFRMTLPDGKGYQITAGTEFTEDEIHKYYADFQLKFGSKPAQMAMGIKAFARMKALADGK